MVGVCIPALLAAIWCEGALYANPLEFGLCPRTQCILVVIEMAY